MKKNRERERERREGVSEKKEENILKMGGIQLQELEA